MKTNESFDSSADNNSETGAETKTDTRKEKDTEPEEEQNLNVELIEAISQTLTTILDDNKNLENYKEIVKNQSKMVFSANTVPNISIKDEEMATALEEKNARIRELEKLLANK